MKCEHLEDVLKAAKEGSVDPDKENVSVISSDRGQRQDGNA